MLHSCFQVRANSPSRTSRVIHPSSAPPPILFVHAAIFGGWVVLFVLQTALIRTRNLAVHRKLGRWGIALGVSIPIVGVATAVVMGRVHIRHGDATARGFLALTFYDMLAFATLFGLAVYWRRRPEFHRRLMLIATCGLTSAAFGRLIPASASDAWIYVGPDALILLGAARDWIGSCRVQPVYRYAIPRWFSVSRSLCTLT